MKMDPEICPFNADVKCPIDEGRCLGCVHLDNYAGRHIGNEGEMVMVMYHAMMGMISREFRIRFAVEESTKIVDILGKKSIGEIKIIRSDKDDPLCSRKMITWHSNEDPRFSLDRSNPGVQTFVVNSHGEGDGF